MAVGLVEEEESDDDNDDDNDDDDIIDDDDDDLEEPTVGTRKRKALDSGGEGSPKKKVKCHLYSVSFCFVLAALTSMSTFVRS